MHRFLLASVLVLPACGSAPSSSSLAGTWSGNALVSFGAHGAYGRAYALQVSVSGNTATISGICGGASGSVGPGMVEAPITTVGTATYASWSSAVTCPPQTFGACTDAVLKYLYGSVLVGIGTDFGVPGYTDINSISVSQTGSAAFCGDGDLQRTSFIGTAVPVP